METRTRKSQNMSLSCILCSMTYTDNPRNQANRPLQLCEKILKSCKEYMDEDDLGDSFMKLNCKRKPLPFCSRCFVTTEKLSELNDRLEEIRAEIMDLVTSFKLEFIKSREVMSIYNSRSTTNKNDNRRTAEKSPVPVRIKEEVIVEESPDSDREPLENDTNVENNEDIPVTGNWPNLLPLDVQESTVRASTKRVFSDVDDTDSELNSDNDDGVPGRKWDSSDSSDEKSTSVTKRTKKKVIKRESTANRSSNSNELYIKTNFELKPDIAEHFIYKGHVVGADFLVVTCKICKQDKRGAKNDLCNFRRHFKIKHSGSKVERGNTPIKQKPKVSESGSALVKRPFKILEKISDHFVYRGHIGDTKNFIMTCKYCEQDKKGQDVHNFKRHLMKMHREKYTELIQDPVTTVE